MKICWLGWFGYAMLEESSGLRQFDPDMVYYVIGSSRVSNIMQVADDLKLQGISFDKVKWFTDEATLLEDLKAFDVVVYDTYIFSAADLPEVVIPLMPDEESFLKSEAWKNVAAKKILFDGESISGKGWYYQFYRYFDFVRTSNFNMHGFYTYPSPNHRPYVDQGSHDVIKVLYSGSSASNAYRKELFDFLCQDPGNYCSDKLAVSEWIQKLNSAKMCLCTYSCASGEKYPLSLKDKEAKALLCGALPLTEDFLIADRFLVPGKERVTFKDFPDLADKIVYYDTHEEERKAIVEAGKKKVLSQLTNDIMWRRSFEAFGLI